MVLSLEFIYLSTGLRGERGNLVMQIMHVPSTRVDFHQAVLQALFQTHHVTTKLIALSDIVCVFVCFLRQALTM